MKQYARAIIGKHFGGNLMDTGFQFQKMGCLKGRQPLTTACLKLTMKN